MGSLEAVSWGYFGTTLFLLIFLIDFGSVSRHKWHVKGSQNGAQNEPKSNINFNLKYEGFQEPPGPSWVRLGSILGRFWVDLGVKNDKVYEFLQSFPENRVFEEDKAQRGILDGTWVDFDAKQGSKKAPKSSPNWIQHFIEKRSTNKIDFGLLLKRIRSGRRSNSDPGRSSGGDRGGTNPSPRDLD